MFGFFSQEFGEKYSFITNGPEQLVLVTAVEGALADEHLVEEDPEAPPVDAVSVLHSLDDL